MIGLIKRLVSLALLALVANATWRLFLAYSAHYKFRDAVEFAAQTRENKTDEMLHDQIVDIAANAEVPVDPDGVVVTHEGIATEVKVAYKRPVEFLPNTSYPWSFSFTIDTFLRQPPNAVK